MTAEDRKQLTALVVEYGRACTEQAKTANGPGSTQVKRNRALDNRLHAFDRILRAIYRDDPDAFSGFPPD